MDVKKLGSGGEPLFEPMTIWELFEDSARRFAEREFLVCDGCKPLTYRETSCAVDRVAEMLDALGVRARDRVAVCMRNSLESVLLVFALAKLGAVRVALNAAVKAFELSYTLDKAKASVLISDKEVEFVEGEVPEGLRLAIVPALSVPKPARIEQTTWDDAMSFRRSAVGSASCGPDDVSDIMFTSGSTGNPKAVPITHRMVLMTAFANRVNRRFEDGRRIFTKLPLFHVFGYADALLALLYVGGCVLTRPADRDYERDLRFMREAQANDLMCVPNAMMHYLEVLDGAPQAFDCLHAVYCSAGPCSSSTWSRIRRAFGADELVQGYGMTEAAGGVTQIPPHEDDDVLSSTVGPFMKIRMACDGGSLPQAVVEHRIVDVETGEPLPAGFRGEVQIRGPKVMAGYVGGGEDADAYADDGWLKTGDLGRMDDRGYLEICGRINDSYRINGENVSPYFVEGIMRRFPLIREVKVVGVPDERCGVSGVAFVRLEPDSDETRKSFKCFCSRFLARFQVPRFIVFLGEARWPLTESGKVDGRELVRRLRGGHYEDATEDGFCCLSDVGHGNGDVGRV